MKKAAGKLRPTVLVSALCWLCQLFMVRDSLAERLIACNGYNSETSTWGDIHPGISNDWSACSPGSAIMAVEHSAGSAAGPAEVKVDGSCCPLPNDALSDVHVETESSCPEGFVATGVRAEGSAFLLRCSLVNSARYSLSAPTQSVELGGERDFLSRIFLQGLGKLMPRIRREALPVWFRYGVLRTSYSSWGAGCLGFPFGGVLSGKREKGCAGLEFRRLLPKHADIPEVMRKCNSVDDPFAKVTRCRE